MGSFSVAAIFSSNMVLQRRKPIKLLGKGEDGAIVTATLTLNKNSAHATELHCSTAVNGGVWMMHVPECEASENCELVISSGETRYCFFNIAIGEVFLCGGQSNMEYELQNCTTATEHLMDDNPKVRYYYTNKNSYIDEKFLEEEKNTSWECFSSEAARRWSAVGYIFGKKLSESLGVTVGLIGCNWGGSSASAWMSEEALSEDSDTATYLSDYYGNLTGISIEEQIKSYDSYLETVSEWNKRSEELKSSRPSITSLEIEEILGQYPWLGPINCKSPYRPAGLYETMLKRVAPFSLKGFLFYQGESDDYKPEVYYKLFKRMIKDWRMLWGEELPFVYVQLPRFINKGEVDKKHWPIIREAQERVSKDVPKAYMITAIDQGEFDNIHPREKEVIADRLYRMALFSIYNQGTAEDALAPEFNDFKVVGNKVLVEIENARNGLVVKSGEGREIVGFELAGEDGEFYDAVVEVGACAEGIWISAKEVKKPYEVRYLWSNYPAEISLYSKAGIPLKPFRRKLI